MKGGKENAPGRPATAAGQGKCGWTQSRGWTQAINLQEKWQQRPQSGAARLGAYVHPKAEQPPPTAKVDPLKNNYRNYSQKKGSRWHVDKEMPDVPRNLRPYSAMSVEDPDWGSRQPPGVQLSDPVKLKGTTGGWTATAYEDGRPTMMQKLEMAGRPRRRPADHSLLKGAKHKGGPKQTRAQSAALIRNSISQHSDDNLHSSFTDVDPAEVALAREQLRIEGQIRRVTRKKKKADSALQELHAALKRSGQKKDDDLHIQPPTTPPTPPRHMVRPDGKSFGTGFIEAGPAVLEGKSTVKRKVPEWRDPHNPDIAGKPKQYPWCDIDEDPETQLNAQREVERDLFAAAQCSYPNAARPLTSGSQRLTNRSINPTKPLPYVSLTETTKWDAVQRPPTTTSQRPASRLSQRPGSERPGSRLGQRSRSRHDEDRPRPPAVPGYDHPLEVPKPGQDRNRPLLCASNFTQAHFVN